MSDETAKQDTEQAWFVITEPGDEEQFLPGVVEASPEPAPTAVLPPKESIPPAMSNAEEHEGRDGVETKCETSVPSEVALPEAEPDPRATLVAPETAPVPSAEQLRPQPAEDTHGQVHSDAPVPAGEELPQRAVRDADFGFRQSDVIRVGESNVTTPLTQVGLVITVRTPQRVRLGQEARTVLGRGRVSCFVDDLGVADSHAVITCQGMEDSTGFCLHTCESAPIAVNGETPDRMVRLQSGDRIKLGDTELVFLEVPLHFGGSA
jgi:hypothetical protein